MALLRDKDREALIQIFASANTPMEVWLYGSRVQGTAHEGSDIDLVIRTPNLAPLSMEIFLELKEKIQDSQIPVLVDLLDWARIPAEFHANIESSYQLLFKSKTK